VCAHTAMQPCTKKIATQESEESECEYSGLELIARLNLPYCRLVHDAQAVGFGPHPDLTGRTEGETFIMQVTLLFFRIFIGP
jgi:hypothetical protein